MNLLDLVFILVLVGSVVLAMFKGLFKELVSIAALVIGVIVAGQLYRQGARLLAPWMGESELRSALGFLVVFFGILLAAGLIMFIVDRILKFTHLKWIDRLLGGLFGLLRGWLVCAVIVLAMTACGWQVARLRKSGLAPYLLMTARAAILLVPAQLRQEFEATYRSIYRGWLDEMPGYRPAADDNGTDSPKTP